MALTRAEKLHGYIGKKIPCDYCGKKKILTEYWLMTEGAQIICPECLPSCSTVKVSW